jgi:hypothetical protein
MNVELALAQLAQVADRKARKALLVALFELDATLALHGVPALSPKWRADLTRWAERGTRRLVIRAGRRSGKSLTLCKLAVALALYGGVTVPTGDTAWAVFVSTTITEALARLATIATFLDLLGVAYERNGNQIRIKGAPLGFVVLACSHKSAVGLTAFAIFGDEVSRWETEGVNPAEEVAATLLPMTLTIRQAIDVWSSSVLGTLDLHAQMFDAGDDDGQTVMEGKSWELNPTVTEAQCRANARTLREFLREFANVAQAALSSSFDPDAVERAFRAAPPAADWSEPVCIVDASSGGGDSFTWALAQYVVPAPGQISQFATKQFPRQVNVLIGGVNKMIMSATDFFTDFERDAAGNPIRNPEYDAAMRPTAVFSRMGSFDGRFAGSIAGSQIVETIARECRSAQVTTVIGDQREALFLGSEFSRHKLRFIPIAWTNSNKIEAVTRLKRMFAEDGIVLPVGRDKLKKELLNYAERITPSGAITFSARGTGHDDEAALLITFALGELERLVPGSPAYIQNTKHVVSGR